jgi:hypothetical protein
MAKPFEPIGDVARWQMLYELVDKGLVGDEFTYGSVQDLLGCGHVAALSAMRQANERLIAEGKLGVRTVDGFGWIKMSPLDLIEHVTERRMRATRQDGRGLVAAQAVQMHRDALTQFERERADQELRIAQRRVELGMKRKITIAERQRLAELSRSKELEA